MTQRPDAAQLPLVSLGIPTYNRPQLLDQALQCALAQTYPALEIMVSDNASAGPEVAEILEKYRGDPRVVVWRHAENRGMMWNLHFLLEQARGEYYLWLADDDSISPNYVEALVQRLMADADTACAFSRYRHIAQDGTVSHRRRGFEGSSAWSRAVRYLMQPDDGFFYGVHRTRLLRSSPYRKWWWPNREIATNWAYPFLFDVVLTGKVSIVDDAAVEWVNDERAAKNYSVPGSLYGVFQYAALRLNVHAEYVRRAFVRRGPFLSIWVAALGFIALTRDYVTFAWGQFKHIVQRLVRMVKR
jgi:glycosyltransferase involved in cell wall biosynthesis